MRNSNIVQKIIILALILALPGFLYYLLTVKGKNRYQALSIFGPKELGKTTHNANGKIVPDTIYHTLTDFNLVDQQGKPVSFQTFENKIIIVNFFYTHCPNICNEVNHNISNIVADYAKNKMVEFVSITVDPGRDSVAALKKYADQYKVSPSKWLFLTGDTTVIYPLARKGFLVNALDAGSGDFIYSDKIMLVDPDKRIRGYYSGTLPDDVQRLDDEIKVLVSQELLKKADPVY